MDDGDGTKQLFTVCGRSFRNVGHDGRLDERAVTLAADADLGARIDGLVDLVFELNGRFLGANRTVTGGLIQWIAGLQRGEELGRAVEELLSD